MHIANGHLAIAPGRRGGAAASLRRSSCRSTAGQAPCGTPRGMCLLRRKFSGAHPKGAGAGTGAAPKSPMRALNEAALPGTDTTKLIGMARKGRAPGPCALALNYKTQRANAPACIELGCLLALFGCLLLFCTSPLINSLINSNSRARCHFEIIQNTSQHRADKNLLNREPI